MLHSLLAEKYHPICFVERTRAGSWSTVLLAMGSEFFNSSCKMCCKLDEKTQGEDTTKPTGQWPPNSPDLNPIENLFSKIDGKLAKEEINTLQDLTVAINRIISKVPDHLIKNLVRVNDKSYL